MTKKLVSLFLALVMASQPDRSLCGKHRRHRDRHGRP